MNNSETHNYEVNLQWNSERKGTLSSPVLPIQIETATPPDFPKGIKDIWTAEHLFIAAVNGCFMQTFLAIADNSHLEIISFDCNAVGIVETVNEKLAVSKITLKPKVGIKSADQEEQLRKILEMADRECLICNSVTTQIILDPIVEIQ